MPIPFKSSRLAYTFLAALMPHSAHASDFPPRVCDVRSFGANGNQQAIALSTKFIQAAIDACAAAGGGTVELPAGNYLSEPLVLKSNIRLHLAKDAILIATTDEASFRVAPDKERPVLGGGWLPFISVPDAQNVSISGEGIIDGQGAVWWERWRADVRANPSNPTVRRVTNRPRLITVSNSRNVLIEGVNLVNSPSFHIVLRNSEDIDITRTRITAPRHAPNTDAIDPTNSRNIRITYNTIDCNDDHVAIKAEKPDPKIPEGVVSNIYIAHNTLLQGRGISIGSETSGGVRGILVEHNTFVGSMYGLRIKSPRGKGGPVRDVVYRDITMTDVAVPLVFSGYYEGTPTNQAAVDKMLAAGGFVVGDQIYPPETDEAQAFQSAGTPRFVGVTISNLRSTGASKSAGYFVGLPEAAIADFVMENVHIEADTGLLVRNAHIKAKGLQIKARQGPPILLQRGGEVTATE
ncbi:MAG: exo-poly-alpha-D-galacturonosidase [Burkholderiales bacterium PBB3]|nr:MAG: exo-poly-alpha-D-galacturonosidase [Burkholderiales bacterium PBB3]